MQTNRRTQKRDDKYPFHEFQRSSSSVPYLEVRTLTLLPNRYPRGDWSLFEGGNVTLSGHPLSRTGTRWSQEDGDGIYRKGLGSQRRRTSFLFVSVVPSFGTRVSRASSSPHLTTMSCLYFLDVFVLVVGFRSGHGNLETGRSFH